jgi:hypothetical protein
MVAAAHGRDRERQSGLVRADKQALTPVPLGSHRGSLTEQTPGGMGGPAWPHSSGPQRASGRPTTRWTTSRDLRIRRSPCRLRARCDSGPGSSAGSRGENRAAHERGRARARIGTATPTSLPICSCGHVGRCDPGATRRAAVPVHRGKETPAPHTRTLSLGAVSTFPTLTAAVFIPITRPGLQAPKARAWLPG